MHSSVATAVPHRFVAKLRQLPVGDPEKRAGIDPAYNVA
jgi:hypothetical protein